MAVGVVVDGELARVVFGLDGGPVLACLAKAVGAGEVLLADLFAVAFVVDFARLRLGGALADAVFADEGGLAAIRCIAEMAFAAKDAFALLRDVWVEGENGEIGEACWWCREIPGPVKVVASFVGAVENVC